LIDHVNPDEVVARGAAIQGILSILNEENASGKRVVDEAVREKFSTLAGGLIEVTDITSHTLGVVLWDEKQLQEYVFPMIRKMTPVPAVIKNSFGTADANMQRAVVKVVEGESTVPAECTPLGVCDIQLPPYLPKGSPVKLTYQYNANQVLEVEVQAAGNNAKVTIDRNTGLAPADIAEATSSLEALKVS
jgi:molecular chaperone DnaK